MRGLFRVVLPKAAAKEARFLQPFFRAHSSRQFDLVQSARARLRRAQVRRDLLEFATPVLGAGQTITFMVAHEQFDRRFTDGIYRWCRGVHDHTLGDGRGAGSGQSAHLLYFDDTKAAAAIRLQVGVVAESGVINSRPPRRLEDGMAFRRFDLYPVNCQLNRFHDKSPLLKTLNSNIEIRNKFKCPNIKYLVAQASLPVLRAKRSKRYPLLC